MYKRKNCGQPADGVLIKLGSAIATPQKAALPIDFTKVIECTRGNLLPKISVPVFHDKFDIEIENNIHIPSNVKLNQVNKININTDDINTTPVIPNLGNISVTNVLPANAKVIFNLIPIAKSNIPIKNIGSNDATVNITAKNTPTTGNPTLHIGVTDNRDTENAIVSNNTGNITVAEILPTENSQKDNIESSATNALTHTRDAKVLDTDLVTVVKETVSKGNEKESIGLNEVTADTGNLKSFANITQTISNVETNILTISNANNANNGTSPVGGIRSSATENVKILNKNNVNHQNASNIPSNMYTLIRTSAGSYLIPISAIRKTNTVNSVTAPIVSTGVTTENTVTILNKNTIEANIHSVPRKKNDYLIPEDTHKELKDHCKCCIVLKKICKEKQTCITDFFTSNKHKDKTCQCTDRRYPKTTKRLKLFLRNYKSHSWCVHKELQSKLKLIKQELQEEHACASEIESLQDEYSLEDIGK